MVFGPSRLDSPAPFPAYQRGAGFVFEVRKEGAVAYPVYRSNPDELCSWTPSSRWQEMPDRLVRGSSRHAIDSQAYGFREWLETYMGTHADVYLLSHTEAEALHRAVPREFVRRREDGCRNVDSILCAYRAFLLGRDGFDMERALYEREVIGQTSTLEGPHVLWWAWDWPKQERGIEREPHKNRYTQPLLAAGIVRLPCRYCMTPDMRGEGRQAIEPLTWQNLAAEDGVCARCRSVWASARKLMNVLTAEDRRAINKVQKDMRKAVEDTAVSANITKVFVDGKLPKKYQLSKTCQDLYTGEENAEIQTPHIARQSAICAYLGRFPTECPDGLQRDLEPWARRIAESLQS